MECHDTNFHNLYIKDNYDDNDQYLTHLLDRQHDNVDDVDYHIKTMIFDQFSLTQYEHNIKRPRIIENKSMVCHYGTDKLGDVTSDIYIRFKIKGEISDFDLIDALKIISQITVEYNVGGTIMYKVPLYFNILICKMLNKEIKVLDRQHDEENAHYKIVHDYLVGTTKYCDDDGYYLDIPLLDDFYLCKNGGNLLSLRFHPPRIYFYYDDNIERDLLRFFDKTIYYGYERIEIHLRQSTIWTSLVYKGFDYAILIPKSYNYITNSVDCDNIIHIHRRCKCKFIFISLTHLYESLNILPLILEIEITCKNGQIFNLPIDNMELYEYNDSLIYGTTLDTNYCMKDWLQCENEYNDLYTICNNNLNNGNLNNNFNDKDKIKCIEIQSVQIILSDHYENVSVDVTLLEHNLFRNMGGMGGNAFET
jgi:hypothetical protein